MTTTKNTATAILSTLGSFNLGDIVRAKKSGIGRIVAFKVRDDKTRQATIELTEGKSAGQRATRNLADCLLVKSVEVAVAKDTKAPKDEAPAKTTKRTKAIIDAVIDIEPTMVPQPSHPDRIAIARAQWKDVDEASSMDVIAQGKVRTLELLGALYTTTNVDIDERLAVAHRLYLRGEFLGAFPGITPRTYAETIKAKIVGAAFHFGMIVTVGRHRDEYILGPAVQLFEDAKTATPTKARTPRAATTSTTTGDDKGPRKNGRLPLVEGAKVRYRAGFIRKEGIAVAVVGARVTIRLSDGTEHDRDAKWVTVLPVDHVLLPSTAARVSAAA